MNGIKFCKSAEKCFSKPFFFGDRRKKNFKTFFLRKTLAFVSLALYLGLEHSCPWPRIFFVSLALASSLVSSTPPLLFYAHQRWSRGHKARGQGQGQGKKIRGQGQGQGQPFRGQTLSRPRTRMLEAKAKDQGHKAQVLFKKKKKKGLHKNFSSDLHEKTLSKKFFNHSTKF